MQAVAQFKDGDLWVPVEALSIPDQMIGDHPEWFENCCYLVPSLGSQFGSVGRSINLTAYMKHVTAQAIGGWIVEVQDAKLFESVPVFNHAHP